MMLNTISRYASMVKFSHTLFALPFALVSYVYALAVNPEIGFDWLLLIKILLCMVFARNAAMGFNRWADRNIDAVNPRTAGREIPSGKITPRAALTFVIINSIGFVAVCGLINTMTFLLSPIALFVVIGYSFTKRFTAWSHIVLGTALAIAPIGAYIAVTGHIAVIPVVLAGVVVTWVGGFDILYSMQDSDFDRDNGLHSIPARFNNNKAAWISIALHAVSIYGVIIMGLYREFHSGPLYWTGTGIFIGLLIIQHVLYIPSRIDRIGASFGLVNGLASLTYAGFSIAEMLLWYF